jgi:hypothetical protein
MTRLSQTSYAFNLINNPKPHQFKRACYIETVSWVLAYVTNLDVDYIVIERPVSELLETAGGTSELNSHERRAHV